MHVQEPAPAENLINARAIQIIKVPIALFALAHSSSRM
jgi:hypothetical protein